VKQTEIFGSYSFTQRPNKINERVGYGEEYKYAHDYNNNFADQNFQKHLKKHLFIFLGTILEKTASGIFKRTDGR
jgi:replication-associated recombination protein RarA